MSTARKHDDGQLPDGWRMVRLGDLCEPPEYGAAASAEPFDPDLPRYVRITDISDDGRLRLDGARSANPAQVKGFQLNEGDFLFARSGSVGRTYLYRSHDGPCVFAGYLIRFRTDPELLLPEYLNHFTHSASYYRWVSSMLRVGAQPNINATEYSSLTIPLPPLPEQRAIADVLDSIDEAIERTEAVIAATETLRDSLLHELLTRGVPGWHAEWKDVPGIGTIPVDWEVVRLGEVAEVIMGQSPPGENCNQHGQGIPLLNGPTEYGTQHPEPVQWTTDPKKMSREKDILFCVRGATAGRMNWADRDYAIGRGVAAIRHRSGPDYRRFIRAMIDFKMPEFSSVFTGSTFPNLSYDDITTLRVPNIPISEQSAIARVLTSIDESMDKARAERGALQSHKESTADALLNGRVRIRL